MIVFTRNKLVGVEEPVNGLYLASGLLEDHIYGLEVRLRVDAATMTIKGVEGAWRRYTTPDCPRAVERLNRAEGLCLVDDDFSQRVHKLVGRQACRHFANLILECCDCVIKAAALEKGELAAAPAQPAGSEAARRPAPEEALPQAPAQPPADASAAYAQLEDAPEGFFIDLHVHTFPASPCATDGVDQVLAEAKRIGLDGICITDHNYLWDPAELESLAAKHGLLVLGGNEVTTAQGDMVVFGLDRDIQGIITLAELRAMVEQAGGFLIAAHPFRGFLTVGVEELGMEVEKAAGRPMFGQVDALETLNSKVTASENQFCAKVAQALGRPATGGSDAHLAGEVGINATRFAKKINNRAELLAALRQGEYQPIAFRQMRKVD